jgi:hypothetical protein
MRQLVFFLVLAIAIGINCTKQNMLDSSVEAAALASNSTTVPEGKIMVITCDTTFIDDTTLAREPVDTSKAVVFFGSSTIAQWNVAQSFPNHLVKKAGFGGRTWAGLYLLADTIARLNPKQVVIYSGDNDLIARRSVAQMTTDIQRLINRIWTLAPDVPVVFLYTKPSDTAFKILYADKITTGTAALEYTNRNIANWGRQNHATKFVAIDTYTPFLLWNPKRLDTKYYQADRLHLNQSMGYPVLNRLVTPALK